MCSETVKNVIASELKFRNCCFHHEPVDSLVRSQWQSKPKNTYFLIYRWLLAVILVAVLMISVYSSLQTNNFDTFFIYLTNWAVILNVIVGIYSAVLVTVWHIDIKHQETILNTKEMPTPFKIYWALHNIALVMAFVITMVYWSKLYDAKNGLTLTDFMSHAMNTVIFFIDILIVAHPIRLYHVIQPICFGISYALFSYIYYLAGGTGKHGEPFIYPILSYVKPEKALISIAIIFALVVMVHIFLFFIYKLRVFTHRKLYAKTFILPSATVQTTYVY